MTFHDSIAQIALRDGDTPEQFRSAAQKKANAFWIYAGIGALVWYLAGWGWSLVPFGLAVLAALQSISSTMTAKALERLLPYRDTAPLSAALPDNIDLNDVLHIAVIDDIREKYSSLLADESHQYSGCIFRPVSILPYPKATIGRALRALLDFVEGREPSSLLDDSIRTPEVADMLRVSLAQLEDFLDVPAEALPSEPHLNLTVGSRLSGKTLAPASAASELVRPATYSGAGRDPEQPTGAFSEPIFLISLGPPTPPELRKYFDDYQKEPMGQGTKSIWPQMQQSVVRDIFARDGSKPSTIERSLEDRLGYAVSIDKFEFAEEAMDRGFRVVQLIIPLSAIRMGQGDEHVPIRNVGSLIGAFLGLFLVAEWINVMQVG